MTHQPMAADGDGTASRPQVDRRLNASVETAALLGQHAHGFFQTP